MPKTKYLLSAAVLLTAVVTAVGAHAWLMGPSHQADAATPAAAGFQSPARGRNLALRPEASAMSRRLGRRYHAPGLEVTTLHGTLTVGGRQRQARIVRTQSAGGEAVALDLAGPDASLAWDAARGATSAGSPAEGDDRLLIERLALDGPDQFVLAQLRGAVYDTVAREAMPDGEGGRVDYAGPLYDLVRVDERPRDGVQAPLSPWRLYRINSQTRLIESVVSEEGGEAVTAEVAGWAEQAGEHFPTRVTWIKGGEAVMELTLNTVTHTPARQ